jgi:DNA repair protein RecO
MSKNNYTGFIVRKTSLKESDLIIDIFTRSDGIMTVYAFKARSPKSKRKSLLEIMNLIEFSVNTPKSKNLLPVLKEININSEFSQIKNKQEFHSSAFLLAEVTNKILQHDDPEPETFALLENVACSSNAKIPPKLIAAFIITKLLYNHGFITQFDLDIKTSQKIDKDYTIVRSDTEPGYFNTDVKISGNQNQKLIREIKLLNFIISCQNFRVLEKLNISDSDIRDILDSILNMTEMVIESKLKSRNLLNSY